MKDGHPARIRNLQAVSAEGVLGAPAATIVRNRCHQRLHRATGSTSFAGRPESECQGLTAVHTRRQTPFHFRVLQGQHPSLTSRVVDASGSWGNAHRKNLCAVPALQRTHAPDARRQNPVPPSSRGRSVLNAGTGADSADQSGAWLMRPYAGMFHVKHARCLCEPADAAEHDDATTPSPPNLPVVDVHQAAAPPPNQQYGKPPGNGMTLRVARRYQSGCLHSVHRHAPISDPPCAPCAAPNYLPVMSARVWSGEQPS